MSSYPEIAGLCPPRFAAVKDAFASNFADPPEGLTEQGARFSACVDGEVVIDLIAGWADTAGTRPFEPETLTPVFSTGKAVMALMIAACVERGLLDYDRAVADYWPEFGQAGKQAITVAELMSHQAGLPGFDAAVEPDLWFDRDAVLARLCAQSPMWAPGAASGYHPITIGYLAGELFRRVDGRTMGTALRQDLPGLDLWLGLPEAEHPRVAQMRKPPSAPDLGEIDAIKRAAFLDRGSSPGGRGSREWRMMEIPSANLHGTARDLARALAVFATGEFEGRQMLSPEVRQAATCERIRGQDRVLPFVMGWAAGLTRNAGLDVFGPGRETVGHYGWGGSCAFADPERRLSGSYVMNRQSRRLLGDPRAVRLIDALYSGLGA